MAHQHIKGGLVVQWLGCRTCDQHIVSQLPAVHCWVTTRMGYSLCVGKPSRHVTSHLGQLSFPSLRGR